MIRFHITVINFGRIHCFLENFAKIKNFDPAKDTIYVVDSSRDFASQQNAIRTFADQNGWRMDQQIHILRREDWGRDQGARIDYFALLHSLKLKPKYIWQFQDHYLDLASDASWWPIGTYNIDGQHVGGQVKSDTIPDGTIIDLNECERIYELYPQVCMLYADRYKRGIFASQDRRLGTIS
jgi:hypothetical protein